MVLQLEQGLHIRACSQVLAIVTPFQGTVQLHYGSRVADASSMFDLISMAVLPGAEVTFEVHGDGAEQVLDELESLFSQQVLPVE